MLKAYWTMLNPSLNSVLETIVVCPNNRRFEMKTINHGPFSRGLLASTRGM
jgi:hypothetical protein